MKSLKPDGTGVKWENAFIKNGTGVKWEWDGRWEGMGVKWENAFIKNGTGVNWEMGREMGRDGKLRSLNI